MFFRGLVLLSLTLLLAFSSLTSTAAQSTATPTLREMADKNKFHIGAAVYTYHLSNPQHVETLKTQFNMLTPENEAKACELQKARGVFNFSKMDQLMDFAEQNGLVFRGHTLVWHSCTPSWFSNGKFSRDEAIQILRDHIYTVVGRYKGRIPIWDVVNEGIADGSGRMRVTPWQQMIGDDYIELAFRFAHEADPDALLFYNDYGAEGLNAKSDAIYNMVKDFKARGVPIDGVGLQAHLTLGDTRNGRAASPHILGENIKRLGELGVQVQLTEVDFKHKGEPTDAILQQEAAEYRSLLQTCLDSGYCTAFIVWGVTDKYSWLRDSRYYDNPQVAPLLFDDHYQAKPAFTAILDLLARRAGEPPILSDDEVAILTGEKKPDTGAAAVPAPTKSDPAQLAPDSVAGAIYYAPFPLTITLDGETDDWTNVPRVTVDKGPTIPAGNDTSYQFAVTADDKNLYFLAEVKDSKLAYGTHNPASEWYQEDSVEFYLNTTGDLTLTGYQPGVAQIGILAANITKPDAPLIGGGNSDTSQVSVVAVKTEDGYRIEASVPLVTDMWKIEPKHMGVLGFQSHLNGSSADSRDTKLIWSAADTQDESWTNPSVFGQLVFWDKTK